MIFTHTNIHWNVTGTLMILVPFWIQDLRWIKSFVRGQEEGMAATSPDSYRGRTFTLPLWTEGGFGKDRLLHIHQERGSAAFERGFRQHAMTDEDRTFPSFLKCKKPLHLSDMEAEIQEWPKYSGVDPSSESRPGSAIFTLAKSPKGLRLPIEIRRGQWSGSDLVANIADSVNKWGVQICMVENNALQDIIRQWALEKDMSLPLKGYHTGHQKQDEIEGLPGMEVEMENASWLFAAKEWDGHPGSCQCGWCQWEREMLSYPQAETSDCVMAMWFAREASRKGGIQIYV